MSEETQLLVIKAKYLDNSTRKSSPATLSIGSEGERQLLMTNLRVVSAQKFEISNLNNYILSAFVLYVFTLSSHCS